MAGMIEAAARALGLGRGSDEQGGQRVNAALGEQGQFYSFDDPRVIEFLRDGNATRSGKLVSEKSALSNATLFRAANLISGAIGMLPLNLMEKDAEGNGQKARGHPAYKLLRPNGKPNGWQTPLQFKSYMQGRLLLHGNAFALKIAGVRGIKALVPLDPKRVDVTLNDSFEPEYRWRTKSGAVRLLRSEEVLHVKAPWSSDGITGDALIRIAAEALGLADAADEAAARLLKNGAFSGGALKHKGQLSKEAIEKLRDQFEDRYSGSENAGRWMLLEEGMEAAPFGMTGKDAQGLETRKHQAEEIARFTGVPRPLLMFDETSWGSGIEQLGLYFVTYCLLAWFVAWEEARGLALLNDSERETHYFKFNEAALLRGSLKDQAEFFSKALGAGGAPGFMVPNEAREKMDMNKHPDGDKLNPGSNGSGGN